MDKKTGFYKRIKIAGMLSYIPIVLISGIFAGYFSGLYLEQKFQSGFPLLGVCVGIGIIVAVLETIRIIKLVIKIDKEG